MRSNGAHVLWRLSQRGTQLVGMHLFVSAYDVFVCVSNIATFVGFCAISHTQCFTEVRFWRARGQKGVIMRDKIVNSVLVKQQ